jgi:hypothetical protein
MIEILRHNVCHCGRHKKRGHFFCGRCYRRLSEGARGALHLRFDDSYGRAVEELKVAQPRSARYVDPRRRSARAGGGA